jgi:hypothetical protein
VALVVAVASFLIGVFPTLEWHDDRLHLALPIFNGHPAADRVGEAIQLIGYAVASLVAIVAAVAAGGRRTAVVVVIAFMLLSDGCASLVGFVGDATSVTSSGPDIEKAHALRSFMTLLQSIPLSVVMLLVGVRAVRPLGIAARVALCVCALVCLVHPSVVDAIYAGVVRDRWNATLIFAQLFRPAVMLAVVPLVWSAPQLRWYAVAWAVGLPFFVSFRRALEVSVAPDPTWWLVGYTAVSSVLSVLATVGPGWLFAWTPGAASAPSAPPPPASPSPPLEPGAS